MIRLKDPPFCGEIFSHENLKRGRWFVKLGAVRVVTVNLQGRFSGVFGQVQDAGGGPPVEVSLTGLTRARVMPDHLSVTFSTRATRGHPGGMMRG